MSHRRGISFDWGIWYLLGILIFGGTTLPAAEPATKEIPAERNKRYEFRKEHDLNGIGKFYMGREIARVMGAGGIPWLERPTREDEEAPSHLVELLKLNEGDVVADVGAGSGLLTFKMASKVGPKGKVYAVDVQEAMLRHIERKRDKLKLTQVQTVLSTDRKTKLPPQSLDLAIMVDVYHEFAYPYEMMLDLSEAMKPGGRVVLVEYRREDPNVPIKLVHKMSVAQVKRELEPPELHLRWKELIDKLPRQHVLIFEKLSAEEVEKKTEVSP